jgi:PAS domain S-box-containing protein
MGEISAKELMAPLDTKLAALYRLTDQLYRAQAANEVYDAAFDAITVTLGCRRASILLFDTNGVMRFVAQKGLSPAYVAAVDGHSPWHPGQAHPDPIFVENIDDTNEPQHIKEVIKNENITGLAFLPLNSQGIVIGKFMTYYEQPHKFTPVEIELAITISRQLGFAVERLRGEQLRREMVDADRYRTLVEAITDYAVYLLDPIGNVVSWNPGAKRFKGYDSSEIIGKNFSIFYTAADQAAKVPQSALATAAKEGKFETEGWRVRKDGSRFWTHVVIDAIRNSSGSLIGFAKITRDLTERKVAEQALAEARDALFQAQKLEAIGQLTGGIAHDFNNLLMVIQSSMELLRKRLANDERGLSLVDNATEGVMRGQSLTQRMLSFARRQDLDQKAVNLHELVFEMTDLLQRSLGPSILIELNFPMGLSNVRTDSNQLESALLNLAVNARDAMPNGGPLKISAYEENISAPNSLGLTPGTYVCLSIADRGEGMSAETISRATEPFFTTKGVGKGTGLGLSMVQGFAEQSGGRFKLRSEMGVGTIAEIWLPATNGEGELKADEISKTDTSKSINDMGEKKLVVLAVDDDALVRMGTAAMLEDLGHTVREANSGEEALQVLAEGGKIDLVVTDQSMPRMTGAQLAEKILAQQPNMPIILATGYAELGEGLGTQLPRLSKPFTQAQLAAALREFSST